MASQYLSLAQISRINALKKKREMLKNKIGEAQSAPSVNDFYVKQLKQWNLFYKDEISTLEKRAANA